MAGPLPPTYNYVMARQCSIVCVDCLVPGEPLLLVQLLRQRPQLLLGSQPTHFNNINDDLLSSIQIGINLFPDISKGYF